MADPHWTSYVGMATGLLGSGLGLLGYLKATRMKALDLRIQFRKALSDMHTTAPDVELLLERADKSRMAISSAAGILHSGSMKAWKDQLKGSRELLRDLMRQIHTEQWPTASESPMELEDALIKVHELQKEFDGFKEKYESAMAQDKETQRQRLASRVSRRQ
tara:strand:+ start:5138 stop:5623 length:486 start_codon:yes stop_codon:yes gene_type:complete